MKGSIEMAVIWVMPTPNLVDDVEQLFDEINASTPEPCLSVSHEDFCIYVVRGDSDPLLALASRLAAMRVSWSRERERV